ncbi:hypothetical protein D3C72_938510 [compost metagenome]
MVMRSPSPVVWLRTALTPGRRDRDSATLLAGRSPMSSALMTSEMKSALRLASSDRRRPAA